MLIISEKCWDLYAVMHLNLVKRPDHGTVVVFSKNI
jgi:hypothetical protein